MEAASISKACAWMKRASMHGPVQAHGGPNSDWNGKLNITKYVLDVQMRCIWLMHKV